MLQLRLLQTYSSSGTQLPVRACAMFAVLVLAVHKEGCATPVLTSSSEPVQGCD